MAKMTNFGVHLVKKHAIKLHRIAHDEESDCTYFCNFEEIEKIINYLLNNFGDARELSRQKLEDPIMKRFGYILQEIRDLMVLLENDPLPALLKEAPEAFDSDTKARAHLQAELYRMIKEAYKALNT